VTLAKKLKNRTEQLKILVRDNFTHFVRCKETIDSIHSLLQQNEDGAKPGTSLHLHNYYTGSNIRIP
jgi:exocyst complex component 2